MRFGFMCVGGRGERVGVTDDLRARVMFPMSVSRTSLLIGLLVLVGPACTLPPRPNSRSSKRKRKTARPRAAATTRKILMICRA